METLLDLPNILISTLQTRPSVIHATSHGPLPPNGNFSETFGKGDIMGLLGTVVVALPLVLISKLMQKTGCGGDSDLMRSLTGRASKVMQGDYDEGKPTASLSRLNMAMDQAVQNFQNHSPVQDTCAERNHPMAPTPNSPGVFGRR